MPKSNGLFTYVVRSMLHRHVPVSAFAYLMGLWDPRQNLKSEIFGKSYAKVVFREFSLGSLDQFVASYGDHRFAELCRKTVRSNLVFYWKADPVRTTRVAGPISGWSHKSSKEVLRSVHLHPTDDTVLLRDSFQLHDLVLHAINSYQGSVNKRTSAERATSSLIYMFGMRVVVDALTSPAFSAHGMTSLTLMGIDNCLREYCVTSLTLMGIDDCLREYCLLHPASEPMYRVFLLSVCGNLDIICTKARFIHVLISAWRLDDSQKFFNQCIALCDASIKMHTKKHGCPPMVSNGVNLMTFGVNWLCAELPDPAPFESFISEYLRICIFVGTRISVDGRGYFTLMETIKKGKSCPEAGTPMYRILSDIDERSLYSNLERTRQKGKVLSRHQKKIVERVLDIAGTHSINTKERGVAIRRRLWKLQEHKSWKALNLSSIYHSHFHFFNFYVAETFIGQCRTTPLTREERRKGKVARAEKRQWNRDRKIADESSNPAPFKRAKFA